MITDELLTTEQAVRYLKTSKKTLFKLVQEGKVRALKVGNAYRFKKEEIDEDLRANKPGNLKVATR
ncbi:MAG: helix-turn-helix domain-containing protein [bacterium]